MSSKYRHISTYEKEIIGRTNKGKTLRQIPEHINFYNTIVFKQKTKLTPLEKRNQFVA